MKKTPGDIIILHNCTKNHDHMLHYSWDMARDVCNWYFLFWAIFALLTPYQQEKWNFQKKWKKTPGDIIISQKRPKNHDHMLYCSWDMARDTWNYYFFILGYFLPFNLPPLPNSPKNENKAWRYNHFTRVPKIMVRSWLVPEIWCVTDRRTKKVTHRGGCPTSKKHKTSTQNSEW